jgi:hypothetical protein
MKRILEVGRKKGETAEGRKRVEEEFTNREMGIRE